MTKQLNVSAKVSREEELRTTQEQILDDMADRLEEAEHEAKEWRRFGLVSLAINFVLSAVASVGWFL